MKRITKELESNGGGKEGNLLLQGVRFAYTIHQVPKKKKSHKVICLIKAMFMSIQLFPQYFSLLAVLTKKHYAYLTS